MRPGSPGPLAIPFTRYHLQHTGIQSRLSGPVSIQPILEREKCINTLGQQNSSNLHPKARGYQESYSYGRSSSHPRMGPGKPSRPEGGVCSSSPQSTGRRSKQDLFIQQRMASESSGLFPHNSNLDCPDTDLAATPANTKCLRYLSRTAYPMAEGIDCLQHPWNF